MKVLTVLVLVEQVLQEAEVKTLEKTGGMLAHAMTFVIQNLQQS